jgi:hypothetical protein
MSVEKGKDRGGGQKAVERKLMKKYKINMRMDKLQGGMIKKEMIYGGRNGT